MAKGHRSQIKKERNIATQEKRPHATAKYVGIPATKAKIVLDQIKGKDVVTAAAMLNYSPRYASEIRNGKRRKQLGYGREQTVCRRGKCRSGSYNEENPPQSTGQSLPHSEKILPHFHHSQ